jgi:hypothetical protein
VHIIIIYVIFIHFNMFPFLLFIFLVVWLLTTFKHIHPISFLFAQVCSISVLNS